MELAAHYKEHLALGFPTDQIGSIDPVTGALIIKNHLISNADTDWYGAVFGLADSSKRLLFGCATPDGNTFGAYAQFMGRDCPMTGASRPGGAELTIDSVNGVSAMTFYAYDGVNYNPIAQINSDWTFTMGKLIDDGTNLWYNGVNLTNN